MKLTNLTSSIVYMTILPITYVAIKLGANPTVAYLVSVCAYPGALFFDVWILNKYIGFNYRLYYRTVILKTIGFVIICSIIPMFIHYHMLTGILRLVIVTLFSLSISIPLIYYKGLEPSVRSIVIAKFRSKIPFISNR